MPTEVTGAVSYVSVCRAYYRDVNWAQKFFRQEINLLVVPNINQRCGRGKLAHQFLMCLFKQKIWGPFNQPEDSAKLIEYIKASIWWITTLWCEFRFPFQNVGVISFTFQSLKQENPFSLICGTLDGRHKSSWPRPIKSKPKPRPCTQ